MSTTSPPEYSVRLDAFEGPLDLLLRLIEKAELDITTISLALVTDQYLAYIRQLDDVQPDLLADFLVIAAKLILIKSRALLPRLPVPQPEEENEGEDLVRRLEEYRRFKIAAQMLREREEQGLRSFVRVAPPVVKRPGLTPGEVSLQDLVAAMQRLLASTPTVPVSTVVSPVIISISDRIRTIEHAVAGGHRVHLSGLLMRSSSRLEIIVTFLAVLELIKRGRITAVQSGLFDEIYLLEAPPLHAKAAPAEVASAT